MAWCTVESDPGVFTDLLLTLGVANVTCEELIALEDWALDPLKPVHGLLFLFKWSRTGPPRRAAAPQPAAAGQEAVFFARQLIPNACGTLALLHVLLNHADTLTLGPVLTEYLSFAAELPSDGAMRGEALNDSAKIRVAHNSFARPEPFITESREPTDEDDDEYHFIAYTDVSGGVYEIDGLERAPKRIGDAGGDWLAVASAEIQRRIAEFAEGAITFNLIAVCADRLLAARKRAATAFASLRSARAALGPEASETDFPTAEAIAAQAGLSASSSSAAGEVPAASDAVMSVEHEDPVAAYDAARLELAEAAVALQDEVDKREAWTAENALRRHNLVPFIMEALKQAAIHSKLEGMVEGGKKRFADFKARDAARKKGLVGALLPPGGASASTAGDGGTGALQ